MLETISIENYKSIEKLTLRLGRINVFIGENGAGKSNILEAIALAGAAQADKLDNEFLTSRGIRVTGPQLMRSAFSSNKMSEPIKVSIQVASGGQFSYELRNDNQPYSSWRASADNRPGPDDTAMVDWFKAIMASRQNDAEREEFLNDLKSLTKTLEEEVSKGSSRKVKEVSFKVKIPKGIHPPKFDTGRIEDFIIYAPENSALRLFEREGQIEPLGINGEGLLKLLRVMSSSKKKDAIRQVKQSLKLFGWFKDFKITGAPDDHIEIIDRFLDAANPSFDQRSANEGFLFVAFYLALFTSALTPRFFAVDNIDTSLNPKLCAELMQQLAALAEESDKQVLLTTHNPALLDGLDLSDGDNRLFVVSRGPEGQTRIRHFEKKPSSEKPRRLSDLFLSGALGGLPKSF